MTVSDLAILSNEALVDLGARLETELAEAQTLLETGVSALRQDHKRLLKPGIKLSLNAAAGIAGVALAPVTLGWSLAVTVISSAVTIWDASDYGREANRILLLRKRTRNIRRDVDIIVGQLAEIERILTSRLG